MTSNVQSRTAVREALASLLDVALVGAGKPAQRVYAFRVGDFGGRSPVVVVASRPTNRSKQAQITRAASTVKLDVHTFVLYSDASILANNSPAAGAGKVIEVPDTSIFTIGDTVTISDEVNAEAATITAISADVSITVGLLAHSYSLPKVYTWTERNAEDRLDLLEKMISDVVMDNGTTALWDLLSFDGELTHDPLVIGGKEYLHEIFHINVQLKSD